MKLRFSEFAPIIDINGENFKKIWGPLGQTFAFFGDIGWNDPCVNPGIDSWVSWVEPGLPRKPSS